MKKLLVLCPSRGRPFRLMTMIKSFNETINHNHTELMVLLDKDDKDLGDYFQCLPKGIKFYVFDRKLHKTLTTEIINLAFKQNKNYDFYSVTNDDMEYLTKDWDIHLSNKGKISSGWEINAGKVSGRFKRKIHKACFPYTSIIDGDLARRVGWLQHPDIIHSCGDSAWYWLAIKLKIFNPIEHVKYRHASHYFNDGDYDETAKRTSFYNYIETDYKTIFRWKRHKMMNLVKEIEKENKLCLEQKTVDQFSSPLITT